MAEISENTSTVSEDSSPHRVLIVEDELLVAEDLRGRLEKRGYDIQSVHARAEDALRVISKSAPDLVLMDIRLRGEMDGIEAAEAINEQFELPVIFLTSHTDADTLARAGQSHPYGYLVKPFQDDELHATISMALFRHQAEARLRRMDAWLVNTLESIGDVVVATDRDGRVLYLNPMAEKLTGTRLVDIVGMPVSELLVLQERSGAKGAEEPVHEVLASERSIRLEGNLVLFGRRDTRTPVRGTAAPTRDREGNVTGAVVVLHDCSAEEQQRLERERLNAKLVETQKLESLGVLAGGVAHDFNNLLTSMLANVDMVRSDLPQDSEHVEMLLEVEQSARRAADLCKQMLAFSGHGKFILEQIDLSAFVRDRESLLRASMSKSVKFELDLANELPPVEADASQLDQVLVNLLTNASEAIEDTAGQVTLKTEIARADREHFTELTGSPNLAPGRYVCLTVTDSGTGMDEDVRANVFDPFYSTKFTGRGLGLSAVQGIVRGHGGAIGVRTEPGKGSKFTILLPIKGVPADTGGNLPFTEDNGRKPPPRKAVLIVDDEEVVRTTAGRIVTRLGFDVVTAKDGQVGVDCFRDNAERLKLVLLDLTMPRMNGEESFRQMREISEDVPVLLMSGYNQQTAIARFTDLGLAGFIQKPFTAAALADRVREVIGSDATANDTPAT